MKRLNRPALNASDVVTHCIGSVGDNIERTHYLQNRHHLDQAAVNFDAASQNTNWCTIPAVPRGQPDMLIMGTATKKQLMDLYSRHMVATTGAARDAYDAILVAANGKCPFCGGIGHAGQLDHYLPKAHFPAFSVVPNNLVPCCADCNKGKSSSFPTAIEGQTLHPYEDATHFFDDKWVVAEIHQTDPISAVFRAEPPTYWQASHRQRVISHFGDYRLASRFAVQAATEIVSVIYERRTTFKNFPAVSFEAHLTDKSNAPHLPINGWQRCLYAALATTPWFCGATF